MKFIYVSDLHSNRALFNTLIKLAADEEADALIIGGDVFAYSPTAEPQIEFAEGYLCEFIKKINIPVYIIPGNCDKPLAINYLIHEAPSVSQKWHEQIGDTISVNPGSGDILQAVIFEIDNNGCIVDIKHNLYGSFKISKGYIQT